jgi:GNAT superfamily N-acetyltransferase
MGIEIREKLLLTDDERRALFEWGPDIFGTTAMRLFWRPKDLHFVMYDDAKPVSHAAILKHPVKVGETEITVGGLGGVVTVPEAQRRGLARQVVKRATSVMEVDWQVDAGLLFCLPRMIHYYQALGWEVVDAPVLIEAEAGKISSPMPVMVLPFKGIRWPSGTIDLGSRPW